MQRRAPVKNINRTKIRAVSRRGEGGVRLNQSKEIPVAMISPTKRSS